MKKSLLWVVVLVMSISIVAAFSLFGCKAEEAAVEEVEEEAAVEEEVAEVEEVVEEAKTVKMVYSGYAPWKEWLETAIVEFEALYPNVTVVLEEVLGTGDDYTVKTSLLLQSDDTIDVLIVDSFLLGGFVAADYLAPIPTDEWPEYDQQFSGKVKEGATVDGNVYAISFSTDTRGLYYNTTVFENAGVATTWAPKSWAELMDMIEQLHDADVPYPIWMNASVAHGEGTTMQTFEMFLGGTEDWIYEDGKWVVKAPGITDTLKFIEDLYKMGIYNSTELAVMMEANAWQTIDPLMIASEEVGILLDGNWKGAAFADYTDVIKVTPMPNQAGDGFSSMSGGWTITIPALSQQKDLGMDLIKVVANKENMVNCCKLSGDMSPRADVANDPRYIEPNPLRAEMSAYTEFTKFRPGHELYPSVSAEIQTAVESVLLGQKTAVEAADIYATNVKAIVGDGNWIEK